MQKLSYNTAMRSILGTRKTQQDTAIIYEREGRLLAAVCDGMGGYSGGELASKAAVGMLKYLFKKKQPSQTNSEFLRAAADKMDEAIYNLRDLQGKRLKAGSTVVAVILEYNKLTWLSVGDSRLYIVRGAEMIRATRDHNYFLQLDEMKIQGKLTKTQYVAESARGESLISYLGIGGLDTIDINDVAFEMEQDDRLVLMSDGLYRSVDETKIKEIAGEYGATGAVNILMSLAAKNSPQALDNTTCIIIHCLGDEKV